MQFVGLFEAVIQFVVGHAKDRMRSYDDVMLSPPQATDIVLTQALRAPDEQEADKIDMAVPEALLEVGSIVLTIKQAEPVHELAEAMLESP
jgi:hypothetical protein